ncbi:MAG: hypothetical protein ACWGOX_10095, partial [Desulforhopalus sp.]
MKKQILINTLRSYTRQHHRPDNSPYDALLLRDAQAIARQTGLSLKQVECGALEAGVLPERYSR